MARKEFSIGLAPAADAYQAHILATVPANQMQAKRVQMILNHIQININCIPTQCKLHSKRIPAC